MNNLQVITTETLTKLTKNRVGETKFFEDAKYLTNFDDLTNMLSDTSVKFVLFGIKEDIGVLANKGRPGAKDSWDSTLKSLLNLQSNQTTKASQVLILGHLDFSELYDTLAITKQEKLLKFTLV